MSRLKDERKPFLEHLEELRKRILFSLISVGLLSALSYTYSDKILELLAKHSGPLVFIGPEEAFLAYVKIAFFCGLFLSTPVILFNALKFTWVALHKKERRAFGMYLVAATLLFLAGVLFSYYIVLPAAMSFLLSFASNSLKPYISVSRYITFSAFLMLAFGIAFETPLSIVLLTKTGLVNSRILRKKRKYFILILFIAAAVLTPPDIITQIFLVIPLLALFEASVWIAKLVEKPKS